MKTTIESLTTARQIAKEGRTFVEDANATVVRTDDFGYRFHVQKHDYLNETSKFKTFNGLYNYLYCK